MTIKLKKGIKELVSEAERVITTVSTEEAIQLHANDDESTVFIDIRDIRELERDGMIPGAIHVPRGMTEFWFDPERAPITKNPSQMRIRPTYYTVPRLGVLH